MIFTTTCDSYLKQALEYNSIGYLVKPISQDKLKTAIRKHRINVSEENSSAFKKWISELEV